MKRYDFIDNTKKIDKRIKYMIMLDVETAPVKIDNKETQIIFDIGFCVFDKRGNIYEKFSFVIEEIFLDIDTMRKAVYYNKYPLYLKGLRNGKFVEVPWGYAMKALAECIAFYNINEILAYNLTFDKNAIINTNKYLRPNRPFKLFDNKELNCLWGMFVETVGQQKSYQRFCEKHNLITDSGKFLSSRAETAYAYMVNDPTFVEEHTGLSDVLIEIEIYKRVIRQNKKMTKGILGCPYRKVSRNVEGV